jgi:iron complex outermembrane recepter protein
MKSTAPRLLPLAIGILGSALAPANDAAAADSQSQPAAANRQSARDRGLPHGLEEVIVTAQKRSENIRDVPLSITAITGDDIVRRGLMNTADSLRGVPGISPVEIHKSGSVIIRGMETVNADQNFGAGPTTATYFGETPTTSTAGLQGGSAVDIALVDIERIEALRGPQGTAFGNSSLGGAVRTIPAAPNFEGFAGKVAAQYSATAGTGGDNYSVQGVVNLPIVADKLALRAVAYRNNDSGYYRNRAASDTAFRAASITPYGTEAFAFDTDGVGDYRSVGGRVAALFQATDNLSFKLSYLNQENETDGFMAASANGTGFDQTILQVAPEHVIRGQKEGVTDSSIEITNLTAEYDLGRASVLATYSYTQSDYISAYPLGTFSIFPRPVSSLVGSDHSEHVAEIRFVTNLDGAWNFLFGLYGEDLKDEAPQHHRWFGTPTSNNLDPLGVFDPDRRNVGDRVDTRELEQRAAFGEVQWEFVKDVTLTAGVRAYEYKRHHQVEANGAFYGVSGIHENVDTKVSDENFRANVSYRPSDEALVYAGWSQGFRLGRAQGGLASVCDANGDGIADAIGVPLADTRRVDSDSVDSFEIGGKFTLLDRRLTIDAAAFHMDWSDIPFRVSGGGAAVGCPFTFFTNVGDAISDGVEVQTQFRITDAWRANAGGSWTDARLADDVTRLGLNLRKDSRLPGSPKFNANLGLEYAFQVAGYDAFVRADSAYVGKLYGDLLSSPTTTAGDYVRVDASVRVELRSWYADLFARNLTNEDAFTNRIGGFPNAVRMRPRTIGLQLGYTF